jgi:CRISPR-associated protein Csm1
MQAVGLRLLRELVSLGALFHDIGKLKIRLEESHQKKTKKHKYLHEELGKEVIDELLSYLYLENNPKIEEELKEICKKFHLLEDCENFKPIEVLLSAFYHHEPSKAGEYKLIAEIYRKSDIISATERELELKDYLSPKEKRLHSIFERINFNENSKENSRKDWVYPIKPLEISENTEIDDIKNLIFPFSLEEQKDLYFQTEKEFFEENYGSYKNLLDNFKQALKEILKNRGNNLQSIWGLYEIVTKVYYLFYKYLWSVPSSTYDIKNKVYHYPDISLFDHSRGVASIASALITPFNIQKIKEGKEPQLILIEGDISGIQKFLFGITNKKGASKRLRGRSFFLALLPEILARYILEKLKYHPTINTLYASAGKFQLLIGFEEGIEEKLKELQKEIEEIFLKEFGGNLGIVLAWKKFPLKQIKNYYSIVRELHQILANEKRRKFKETLFRFEEIVNEKVERKIREGKSLAICPYCRQEIIEDKGEEERNICKWCKIFEKIGSILPKTKYIAYNFPYEIETYSFQLSNLGKISFFTEEEIIKFLSENKEEIFSENRAPIFKINATDIEKYPVVWGFKFICQAVPSLTAPYEESLNLKYLLEEEKSDWYKGDIIPFSALQELALGDKKLGYLKADVDNLGLIFMAGLKNYSFSRIATLSRSLDLFFSLYLDFFLRNFKKELLEQDYRNAEEKKYFEKVESVIYTVYSGGDDLFLIAPWNIAIKLAHRIREEFQQYTCHNPHLGISAGLGIFKGNFPIRLAANITDDLESMAKSKVEKDGKKDKIGLWNIVLKWEELKEILDEIIEPIENGKGNLFELVKEGKISRSFLYRLYTFLKTIKDDTEKCLSLCYSMKKTEIQTCKDICLIRKKERLYKFIPYFYYQLARNIEKPEIRKKLERVFIDTSKDEIVNLEKGIVFLSYLLSLTKD